MDKDIITKNFSRYAHFYDRYAQIQKQIASRLLEFIAKDSLETILEIGCGTGNYTLLLREKFKNARLKAVDISAKMVEVAAEKLKNKRIDFMVIDAECMDLAERFELITSNACFQWFEDLETALLKYKDLLKKDSQLLFSMFGPQTFHELNTVLKISFKDVSINANYFISQEGIKKILNENFKNTRIKEVIYTESLLSLKELLDKIKYSGIRGKGLNGKISFTSGVLKNLEKTYLDKFNRIKVTYQVLYCEAKK